jgi:hypothetical protein
MIDKGFAGRYLTEAEIRELVEGAAASLPGAWPGSA